MGLKILVFLMIALFADCMGTSYASFIGLTPNTNPDKQYATPFLTRKGGALFHRNNSPGQALDGKLLKRGEACSSGFLWLFTWGDSSIHAAATAGGIKKIGSVDHEITGFLIAVYQSNCTIVMGE